MIHVFIGTKAQYVKTAPILQELQRRDIPFNLIDSGQHADISKRYRTIFNIKEPDVRLTDSDADITTLLQFAKWFFYFLLTILFRPSYIGKKCFGNQKGVCLIHGDTPTTLLSLFAAKRAKIKVCHLESGLRSFNAFNPFPEEIIRIITMRYADILFAPSDWAHANLLAMKVRGAAINIKGNTNIDALRYISSLSHIPNELAPLKKQYVLVSIHRAETILNKARLKKVTEIVFRIAKSNTVAFCIHPPTKKRLKQYGLMTQLQQNKNILLFDLLPYPNFIGAMKEALFVVTDGGSVQEESYYLNLPCLLLRKCTERMEGISQNVCVSDFNDDTIAHFLNNITIFKRTDLLETDASPSARIVDIISNHFHS